MLTHAFSLIPTRSVMTSTALLSPLIIGEVLFDHFPDGNRVLGGAPLNVAWNLQGMGVAAVLLTAVGDDDEGNTIRQTMDDWGMTTRGLQLTDRPTGRVSVTFANGQPSYEIVSDMAFDFIEPPSFPTDRASFSMMCYGSLLSRSERSRQTLAELIQTSMLDRFVDINIRDPFFDESWLATLLTDARWVKLSDEELSRLSDQSCKSEANIRQASQKLRDRYRIETVLVTCGPDGAHAIGDDRHDFTPAVPIKSLADTVGAGDAFASAVIAGLIRGQSMDQILPNAVAFASKVCSLSGATTTDKSFYR